MTKKITIDEDGEAEVRKACECASCDCDEPATTTDGGGVDVCEACADYYCDEDGQVVCSRTQDDTTCRHCGKAIEWGGIQTSQWAANWCEGSCGCDGRAWRKTEQGGSWELSEGTRDEDADESEVCPPTITAEITGRGADSTVPDDADAVDADIYADGELIGAVTLKIDGHDGRLSTWGGCVEHWADSDVIEWLDGQDSRRGAIASIEDAVRKAAA